MSPFLPSAMRNVNINFFIWDADDPSADRAPIDVVDGDRQKAVGADNKGDELPNLQATFSSRTDANGVARGVFSVSMQPGDNYRAFASRGAVVGLRTEQYDDHE